MLLKFELELSEYFLSNVVSHRIISALNFSEYGKIFSYKSNLSSLSSILGPAVKDIHPLLLKILEFTPPPPGLKQLIINTVSLL